MLSSLLLSLKRFIAVMRHYLFILYFHLALSDYCISNSHLKLLLYICILSITIPVEECTLMGTPCRYTAFIPLYPIGVGPGESKLKICSHNSVTFDEN